MECVFCDLAGGGEKHVYDDDMCYVVLDINPITKGHMLVISKRHYENVLSMPKEVLCRLFSVAQDYAIIAENRLGAKSVNIATNVGEYAGQVVMHAHVHVIPRYGGERHYGRHRLSSNEKSEVLKLLVKGSV